MAITRVQGGAHYAGAAATSISKTISAVGSGNIICGHCTASTGTLSQITSVTDDQGNVYTLVDGILDAGQGNCVKTFFKENITNAPTVITANFGASLPFIGITVDEFTGLDPATGINGHTIQLQTNITSGSSVTSGNFTTTINGNLIYGGATEDSSAGVAGGITAGSGYTAGTESDTPTSVEALSVYQVQGTAGTTAALFTNSTGATNSFIIGAFGLTVGALPPPAFGTLLGIFSVGKTSVTNPMAAVGSATVRVGDLIVAVYSELTSDTVTGVTDNLGNTYTAQNAGSAVTVGGRAFYSRVSVAGALTTVNFACTASANDSAVAAAAFSGGANLFTNPPIDANPANTTGDTTSPFTCPATGTLAQAIELVIAWASVTRGQTNTAATSPNLLAVNQASTTANTASSVHAAVGYQTVAATTSVQPAFTNASGTFTGSVLGTMSFKQAATAKSNPPFRRPIRFLRAAA